MPRLCLALICFCFLHVTVFVALADDAEAGLEWKSFDGAVFPYSKWSPQEKAAPRAVVICVHGGNGAASDFEQLGTKLSQQDMVAYAYELRGQGNDPERKRVGDLRDPADWFSDLDTFIRMTRAENDSVPVFLYGESLGALILMHGFSNLNEDNQATVNGLIYASPLIALPGKLPPFKNFLLRTAMFLWPGFKISLFKLSGGGKVQVAEGNDHWEQMSKTPHYVPRFTLRLLGSIESMVQRSRTAASSIKKPVLILYPGKDIFTKPHQVDEFFLELKSKDKSKRLFAKSHHLLSFDKERNELFKLVGKWILDRS